jgi:hypothetical protein
MSRNWIGTSVADQHEPAAVRPAQQQPRDAPRAGNDVGLGAHRQESARGRPDIDQLTEAPVGQLSFGTARAVVAPCAGQRLQLPADRAVGHVLRGV